MNTDVLVKLIEINLKQAEKINSLIDIAGELTITCQTLAQDIYNIKRAQDLMDSIYQKNYDQSRNF